MEEFNLAEERLRQFSDRDVIDREPARADLIDVLRRLWAQGEASGAPVDGNFNADEVAQWGAEQEVVSSG